MQHRVGIHMHNLQAAYIAGPPGSVPAPLTVLDQESLEVGVPNVARIHDALLGGKDNFAADRHAAARLLDAVPGAAVAARENRAFLGRAVRFLADDAESASSSTSAPACRPPARCTKSCTAACRWRAWCTPTMTRW
jgi:hypothetical protein